MFATTLVFGAKTQKVTVRPRGSLSIVAVGTKEQTVTLRQKLARRGIACSFPWPTWNGDQFEFQAERPGWMSNEHLARLVTQMMEEEQKRQRGTT